MPCALEVHAPPTFPLLQFPDFFLLIEGIDGSGKSTFAEILAEKFKERFQYHPNHSLSIVGQPYSQLPGGKQAKSFIETGITELSKEEIIDCICTNRHFHEEYLEQFGGIVLCVRGLLTDAGTLQRIFSCVPNDLGQRRKIDLCCIVDTEPSIADKRIEGRQIPRTWRESLINLSYFRSFFLDFQHELVKEKIVLRTKSLSEMDKFADDLANQLYVKTLKEAR